MPPICFAINRSCAPHLGLHGFASLARSAGISAVELRNDIGGRETADGPAPRTLRRQLADEGITVASVNALQRFNDWTAERAEEARALIACAAGLGAGGIVLCPLIDRAADWTPAEAERNLCAALRGLAPMLRDAGVTGLVEPLGMPGSTLTRQATAVAAITAIDGWDAFRLCHDTFQFYRCGDDRMFPEHFGLVHISGIARSATPAATLTDSERGFVFLDDRIGNVTQLRHILAAGYHGHVSMETFDIRLQADPAIAARLIASLDYLRATIQQETA